MGFAEPVAVLFTFNFHAFSSIGHDCYDIVFYNCILLLHQLNSRYLRLYIVDALLNSFFTSCGHGNKLMMIRWGIVN